MLNNQNNNLKELLNMFWASVYIQEEIMYVKPSKEHQCGYYKKEYPIILDKIRELHKDISETLEGKIFKLGDKWSNDLFDIIEGLIKEQYGEGTEETKALYFDKNVKKYVDEYMELKMS